MIIFYDAGERVYKLHLNNDDALSVVLRCGMRVDNHGLDHEFVGERLRARVVLEHEPKRWSPVRLDLNYVVWHLSSLRVAHL